MGWWCEQCKSEVGIIIDTYDIHVGDDGEDPPTPDEIPQLVRDMVEWDVICAECEGPVEWHDASGKATGD